MGNLLQNIVKLSLFWSLAVAVSSCSDPKLNQSESDLHFLTFKAETLPFCGIARARKPVFNVCITASAQNIPNIERNMRKGLLTWMRALKNIDNQVSGNIAFSCNQPDLTVTAKNIEETAKAGCNQNGPWIEFYSLRGYPSTVHEIGHAYVGLSDTYIGRQAGACMRDQPQSVMCWGNFGPRTKELNQYSLLWKDDIIGAQQNYKVLFKDLIPPPFQIDPQAAFDEMQPWPGYQGNFGDTSQQFFVRLKRDPALNGQVALQLSAPAKVTEMLVCETNMDENTCLTSGIGKPTRFISAARGRSFFELNGPFIPGTKTITLVGKAGGQPSRIVRQVPFSPL